MKIFPFEPYRRPEYSWEIYPADDYGYVFAK